MEICVGCPFVGYDASCVATTNELFAKDASKKAIKDIHSHTWIEVHCGIKLHNRDDYDDLLSDAIKNGEDDMPGINYHADVYGTPENYAYELSEETFDIEGINFVEDDERGCTFKMDYKNFTLNGWKFKTETVRVLEKKRDVNKKIEELEDKFANIWNIIDATVKIKDD